MNNCYLSLGSNQKQPERQIRAAIRAIRKLPKTSIDKISSLYWTKPWGLTAQQDFCNAVIRVRTTLKPQQLLKHCQLVETKLGRVRKKPWGPRIIDVDIILYEDLCIKTSTLTIPHPLFELRDFVLLPLNEICAQI